MIASHRASQPTPPPSFPSLVYFEVDWVTLSPKTKRIKGRADVDDGDDAFCSLSLCLNVSATRHALRSRKGKHTHTHTEKINNIDLSRVCGVRACPEFFFFSFFSPREYSKQKLDPAAAKEAEAEEEEEELRNNKNGILEEEEKKGK